MKKKILLSLIIAISVVFVFATSASARTFGDLTYEINGSEVTITACSASATAIEIPSTIENLPVTAIKTYAFSNKTSLQKVTLPKNLQEIPDGLFYQCTALSEIRIPSSVKSIGKYAFTKCNSLAGVYIEDIDAWCGISFSESASNPLYYAKKLYLNGELVTDLKIGDETTEISSYAFYNCQSLQKAELGKNTAAVGAGAFTSCTNLSEIDFGEKLEKIGNSAFASCKNLTSIELSERVRFIGTGIFANCTNLESATLPSGITEIPNSTFMSCKKLSNIYLPKNIEAIGSNAFNDCISLCTINIPLKVTEIGSSAFDGCLKLSAIELHDGITSLGARAFEDCAISEVTLPKKITQVPDYLFKGCSNLKSIKLHDGVTKIGYSAFSNCTKLRSVKLSKNLSEIDSSAFSNCRMLKNIVLPESLTTIGSSAFEDCTGLLSIELPYGTTRVSDSMFYGCESLVSVILPETVTSIGYGAFYECTNLGGLTLPENMKTIEMCAFSGCTDLKGIYIPKSLKTVEDEAFANCNAFTTVFYGGTSTDWSKISKRSYNEAIVNAKIVYNPQKKTYKFETNSQTIHPDITDYAIFKPLEITSEELVIKGWYDNKNLSGTPVTFPYYGSATTLYAAWQERDGTSYERAIIAKENLSYTAEFSNMQDVFYYEITPVLSGKYTFTFRGSSAPQAYLYNEGKSQLARTSYGNGNPKSFTYNLKAGEKYYIESTHPSFGKETVVMTIETENVISSTLSGVINPGYVLGAGMGKTFVVETGAFPTGALVSLACYDEAGKIIKIFSQVSDGSTICFEMKESFSVAKVFVWDGFKTLKPLAEAEIIV